MTPCFSTRTDRHSGLVDGVVQCRLFWYRYLHEFHSCPEDVTNISLAQMDLWRIGGGVMWKTPVTKNQAFVHIRSIGRYDSRGTTCHWEIDKKRTTGDLYLPASRAIHRRWGGGSWTLPSPRWCHFSSTLFLLVTYHEGTSPWQRVNSATAPASVYDRSPWPYVSILIFSFNRAPLGTKVLVIDPITELSVLIAFY